MSKFEKGCLSIRSVVLTHKNGVKRAIAALTSKWPYFAWEHVTIFRLTKRLTNGRVE